MLSGVGVLRMPKSEGTPVIVGGERRARALDADPPPPLPGNRLESAGPLAPKVA